MKTLNFRYLLGSFIMLIGAICGVYVGVWVLFIGGIIDIVNAIKVQDLVSYSNIGIGIIKMLFGGLGGWITFILFFMVSGFIKK